ncbi:hypothetical protein GCM10022408_05320 [Hymenobacter fastidiosus]|uniref:Uracil-DNA glycosylase-like domain-containing protein n=1 Tax=Hymenobacter fastidiosus TaxID=486264 RepID=A0ABP7RHA4_9BACT
MNNNELELEFNPWLGLEYNSLPNIIGVKMLLLGESHYSEESQLADFTQNVIRDLAINGRFNYFSKLRTLVSKAIDNPDLSPEQFWNAVAFSNYIQDIVGDTPRIAPTEKMWSRAANSLRKILDETKPDVVLVVGKRLWEAMPDEPDGLRFIKRVTGSEEKWWIYSMTDQKEIPIAYIAHPASGGWSYIAWTKQVKKLLAS